MKHTVGATVFAILAGAGCWFFGLDIIPSIVVVLVLATLGIALRGVVRPADDREWPAAPPAPTDGARREVPELAWALRTPRGIIHSRVIERVRRTAEVGLGRRGLDLDDPLDRARIEKLIGEPAYALLSSPDRPRVHLPALLSVISRLEALERTDPAKRN